MYVQVFNISEYFIFFYFKAILLIDQGRRLQKPNACPDYIYQKMLECWETDKENRPTFKELTDFFMSGPEYSNISNIMSEAQTD